MKMRLAAEILFRALAARVEILKGESLIEHTKCPMKIQGIPELPKVDNGPKNE